jgi:hypothetical protein
MKKKNNNPFEITFPELKTFHPLQENTIKNQAKREKNIIYGARSVQAQIGFIGSRPTDDWDIFSKKPKKSAMKTERVLDRLWGYDKFYTKPAMHPGTFKVMNKGFDNRKGTKDDYGVVDYTKMPKPPPRTINILGNRYRKLSQEKSSKFKALRDKTQKFRHQKDREDVERIKLITGTKR